MTCCMLYLCYYIHLNWICILHEAQNDRRTVYCCVCSVNLSVQTAAKIRKTKTSANVFMLFTFASRGCSTLRHCLQVEVVKYPPRHWHPKHRKKKKKKNYIVRKRIPRDYGHVNFNINFIQCIVCSYENLVHNSIS